jgi:hypothetical protein
MFLYTRMDLKGLETQRTIFTWIHMPLLMKFVQLFDLNRYIHAHNILYINVISNKAAVPSRSPPRVNN